MPIYMRLVDIKGDVSAEGSQSGGVWKTSNFLTADPVGRASREPGLPGVTVFLDQNNSSGSPPRTKITTYICPSDPSVVPISRISLSPAGGGVESRDPAAKIKVEQMINLARSQRPNGRLYLATDVGVFQNSSRTFDAQGRLLIGTEGGLWRSAGAAQLARQTNNLKQMGLAFHNTATVEIVVTDGSGSVVGNHRVERATLSRHPGGANWLLCDGSVK